jgi:hypothetical protein
VGFGRECEEMEMEMQAGKETEEERRGDGEFLLLLCRICGDFRVEDW